MCPGGTHDHQDDVLQNGNPPQAREIPWINDGASAGNPLDSLRRQRGKSPGFTQVPGAGNFLESRRRQMRESIFPAEHRLGRVLQDFDLINANVRTEHRF